MYNPKIKINTMQKKAHLLLLVLLSVCLTNCNNNDDDQAPLNANIIGMYKVTSVKSDTNLRTGGYIGSNSELTPHFTCEDITLEIKPDFSFVWNAQIISQTYNNSTGFYSDLQCAPLTVNGVVTATTNTSFTLRFTHNTSQEIAVFNLVDNNWQYQSTQDVFFQGHITFIDGVDTLYPDAVLTMVYENIEVD